VGGLVEALAGLGDRGDAGRRGEEDRQEDLDGKFSKGSEGQVRLAERNGKAVDLGRCQGIGGLAHRYLRDEENLHKSFSEKCLSWPTPAISESARSGKY